MPPRTPQPRLTEADIPPVPPKLADPPPRREDFVTEAQYEEAAAKHTADRERHDAVTKEVMKERRRMKERLRDQQRDRSGRVYPADDNARRVRQRQQQPEQGEQHRLREAARYEPVEVPEPTEADIHLTYLVDAGTRPSDRARAGWLRGAHVTNRARAVIAERKRQHAQEEKAASERAECAEDLMRGRDASVALVLSLPGADGTSEREH